VGSSAVGAGALVRFVGGAARRRVEVLRRRPGTVLLSEGVGRGRR